MATQAIPIEEAQASLARLVERALQGDDIILGDEQALVRLVPLKVPDRERIPGLNRGEIWTSDDFDASLSDAFWLGEE